MANWNGPLGNSVNRVTGFTMKPTVIQLQESITSGREL